jgi:hypothetical protein
LDQNQSWRIGAWLNVITGSAYVAADFYSLNGNVIATRTTRSLKQHSPRWHYSAFEVDALPMAATVKIRLVVDGEAICDDLAMAPLVANLVFNPEFESTGSGAVLHWNVDPLMSRDAPRSGSHEADPAGGRAGSALKIVSKSWWAVRNIRQAIPDGPTTFSLSGWARWQGETPDIFIAWSDYAGVLNGLSPATAQETAEGWTRFEIADAHPAANAELMAVSIVGNCGTAWFDDFRLEAVRPATNISKEVRVHVNQVGYELKLPKSCVVTTDFFPNGGESYVELENESGGVVGRFPLEPAERVNGGTADDWGGYYLRADFSNLSTAGRYTATACVDGIQGKSHPFNVGEDVLFSGTVRLGVDFFFVQRCGFEVPGWHAACHLDDARLPDGTHIDAIGGWHSAGDYNKLMYTNGDGGVMFALMAAYKANPSFFCAQDRDSDGLPDVLDEARWGGDFVAKMQIPETGGLRQHVSQGEGRRWLKWSAPEVHTDNIVGTEDDPVTLPGEGSSPLAVGGWINLAAELERRGEDGSRYRDHAERLWQHMTEQETGGYSAHSLLSALELFKDTYAERYRAYAERCADVLVDSQTDSGRCKGAFGVFGEHTAGALGAFALQFPGDTRIPRIRKALSSYISFCASTADNPFGLAKQAVGDPEYFFEPTSALGHNWEILTRAWAALVVYRVTGDRDAVVFAMDQIDWVLGKNPYGLCMLEGAGSFNPPRYHHRYDAIPGRERGAVPGAIPNGFVRSMRALDQPGFDISSSAVERDHPSYRTSEPWLTHNMWHLLAMSELIEVLRLKS